jgi:hypothetical protein
MLIRKAGPNWHLMAVGERSARRTGGDSSPSILAGRQGSGKRRVRGPLWCVFIILLGAAGCSLSISGVLLAARQASPPPQQVTLAAWEHACRLDLEPDNSLQTLGDGETLYQASVPGPGKFQADHELSAGGAITLADLMLAAGQPQSGCLDYGLLRGKPVIWVRLVLADGRIEAYSALPSSAKRLSLDAPVYVLYCYTSDTKNSPDQSESWRGFASLAVYRDCPYGGTSTPP